MQIVDPGDTTSSIRFDQANIKQLRCYLINTSFDRDKKEEKKRIGFPDFYHPTEHNINNIGFPKYHCDPANICNYDKFLPDFHDFHWWPGYRGFGVRPEHFHDHCGKLHWNGLPYDMFGKREITLNHHHDLEPFYLADSQVMNVPNWITCLFPAMDQKICGTYKLVVVLVVFEKGWGRHDLRTYTIDKGDVFELVDGDCGESGNITLVVGEEAKPTEIEDIYTVNGDEYLMCTGDSLPIGGMDANGKDYYVQVTLKDGTTALYNPYNWPFDEFIFKSSNENVATVDTYGTIYGHKPGVTTITVTSRRNLETICTYTVTVKDLDSIKIGFSANGDIQFVSAYDDNMYNYNAKDKHFTIENNITCKYLWVFSQRKIHYVKSIESDNNTELLVSQLSSGIRIPMKDCGKKDNYFVYRSAAPILPGTMNFKINYE